MQCTYKKYEKTVKRFRDSILVKGRSRGGAGSRPGLLLQRKNLLLTPYEGLSGSKINLQGSKEIFKHKVSLFFFSGTILSCLD
jgi:hypothetical protein